MKKMVSSKWLVVSGLLAILVQTLISCSSDDSDDGGTKYSYCVFIESEICLEGPFTACAQNGLLSNSCPFGSLASSSSIVSSSSVASSSSVVSSSSVGGSSSSSIVFGSVDYEGKTYKTVNIGGQVWMAENLNYDGGDGSIGRCYDDDPANCDKYGRFYDWATAMAIDSDCNTQTISSCGATVSTKHRGICPEGWHIPTNAEWSALYRYADGTTGTSSPYFSETAGKHLKAQDGWNSCGPTGSGKTYLCEDTYGFAAFPGPGANTAGWLSASEYDANSIYIWVMVYEYEWAVYSYDNSKASLFIPLRCVKD